LPVEVADPLQRVPEGALVLGLGLEEMPFASAGATHFEPNSLLEACDRHPGNSPDPEKVHGEGRRSLEIQGRRRRSAAGTITSTQSTVVNCRNMGHMVRKR